MEPTIIDTAFNWPYTAQDLTVSVNRLQNMYGLVTGLGLFGEPQGLATNFAIIRYAEGRFYILSAEAAEATPTTLGDDDEGEIIVKIPHFPVQESVTVNDIQNKVARGSTLQLETLEQVVDRKLTKIFRSCEITWEFLRVGAIQGKIFDGKGRLLIDLYKTFEVPQKTVYFDLDNNDSPVQDHCWNVSRHMEDNAQGETWTGVEVPVSREFMTKLSQHPRVRETFLGWAQSEARTGGDARRAFPYGGLVFREYNGVAPMLDGTSKRFIPENEGTAVPIGTLETFAEFDGPAVHINEANMPPQSKVFVTQEMKDHGKGVEMLAQTNTLPVVTRPDMVVRVHAGADPA